MKKLAPVFVLIWLGLAFGAASCGPGLEPPKASRSAPSDFPGRPGAGLPGMSANAAGTSAAAADAGRANPGGQSAGQAGAAGEAGAAGHPGNDAGVEDAGCL